MMKDWVNGTIDQLCEVEYGTRVVRKRDAGSKYPTYGGGGATFFMDIHNRQDRMVIARFAMSKQCTRFVEGKFFLNDSGLTINPKEKENVDSKFLNYQILSLNDEIYSLGRGTAQKNLNMDEFRKLKFSYPKTLDEQKRIVAKLDELFALIENGKLKVEKLLADAKELFQSQLNEIFSNGKLKVENGKWVEKALGEVCEKIQDGAHSSPKIQYDEKSENRFLYITSKNIRNNYLKLSNISYVDEAFHNSIYPRCNPEYGDILITKDGANTGNITLNTLKEPFSLLSSVCLIKTNQTLLLPSFLKGYIQSPIGFKNITGKMTGTAIKRIILKTIKKAVIPLPDLDTQLKIVKMLDELYDNTQALESKYQQELDALDELKKSILQKAFNGEL